MKHEKSIAVQNGLRLNIDEQQSGIDISDEV